MSAEWTTEDVRIEEQIESAFQRWIEADNANPDAGGGYSADRAAFRAGAHAVIDMVPRARDEGGAAALRIAAKEARALLEKIYAGAKTASVRQMLDLYDVILDQAADVVGTSTDRAAALRGGQS